MFRILNPETGRVCCETDNPRLLCDSCRSRSGAARTTAPSRPVQHLADADPPLPDPDAVARAIREHREQQAAVQRPSWDRPIDHLLRLIPRPDPVE